MHKVKKSTLNFMHAEISINPLAKKITLFSQFSSEIYRLFSLEMYGTEIINYTFSRACPRKEIYLNEIQY